MNATLEGRRLNPLTAIGGLLFRPAATMWKLREEGPLWLSFVSVWVLGGLGLGHALAAAMLGGPGRLVWLWWAGGVGMLAFEFLGAMLLVHLAAVLVWQGNKSPVMPAGMRTLLRLGGYWYLPSSAMGLILGAAILLAVRSGSASAIRAAIAGIVPLAIAGYIWTAIFRVRMLRTVYLSTWGQAIVIGLIVALLGGLAHGAVGRLTAVALPEAAIASVGWELHRALGADPAIVEALESIPQAKSTLRVIPLSRAPAAGDLVAYYRDREAPPVHGGVKLPKPIFIGRVLAGPGEQVAVEGSPAVAVPEGQALIRHVSSPEGPLPQPELVGLASIAGVVPESDLELHRWVTRFLLR